MSTRERLIEAALETCRTVGFAGASSRVIARAAGVNQALVFYHFGSVSGLLLAALDASSEQRIDRYRAAVGEAGTLEDLVAMAERLYREDERSGHITVVAQMIAGSLAQPELAPEVLARMEPWLDLCEEAFEKVLGSSGLPTREVAHAAVVLYLGLNLLAKLDPPRARKLVRQFGRLAPLLAGYAA